MPKRFKDVLLGGYYGNRNVGDDCFGVIGTWGARRYWRAEATRLLSRVNLSSEVVTVSCLADRTGFKGRKLLEAYCQILKSTLLVWAGGSIFHSRQSWYTPRAVSFLSSKLGIVPAGAIGVSLGPYKTTEDEKFIHSNLRKLRFLALRDIASFEEARSLKLPYVPVLAADLAMLLPMMKPQVNPAVHDRPILGISLCHYERYTGRSIENEKRREEEMLLGLKQLVDGRFDGTLRFFIFNGHEHYGDREITCRFIQKMAPLCPRIEVIDYSPDPISIWTRVSECSLFLSTRLHGCIYAAAADVPCIAVEYHRKCSDFLDDIGTGQSWRIGDMECSAAGLADLLARLCGHRQGFYPRRGELIARAEQNFLGPDFLGGKTPDPEKNR